MCLVGGKSKADRQEKYLFGFLNYNSETDSGSNQKSVLSGDQHSVYIS